MPKTSAKKMSHKDKVAAKKNARAAVVNTVQDDKQETMVSVREEKRQAILQKKKNENTTILGKAALKARNAKIKELILEEEVARRKLHRVEEESMQRFLFRFKDPTAKVRGDRGGRPIRSRRENLLDVEDSHVKETRRRGVERRRPTKADYENFETFHDLRPDFYVDLKRSAAAKNHHGETYAILRRQQMDSYLARTVLKAEGRDHQYNALRAYVRFRNNENLYLRPMDAHAMMARDYLVPCAGYAYACESPEEYEMQKRRYRQFRWVVNKLIVCAIACPIAMFAFSSLPPVSIKEGLRRLGEIELNQSKNRKRNPMDRYDTLRKVSSVYASLMKMKDSIRRSSKYAEHLFEGGVGQQIYLHADEWLHGIKPTPCDLNPFKVTIDQLRVMKRSEIVTLLLRAGIEPNPGPIFEPMSMEEVATEILIETILPALASLFEQQGLPDPPYDAAAPPDEMDPERENEAGPRRLRLNDRSKVALLLLLPMVIWWMWYVGSWLLYRLLGWIFPTLMATKIFLALFDLLVDDPQHRAYVHSIGVFKHAWVQFWFYSSMVFMGQGRHYWIAKHVVSLISIYRPADGGVHVQSRLAGVVIYLLLILGGIETNPGPPKRTGHTERQHKAKERTPGAVKALQEQLQDLQGKLDAQKALAAEAKEKAPLSRAEYVPCNGSYLADAEGFPLSVRNFPESLRCYKPEEVYEIYDNSNNRNMLLLMWHFWSFVDDFLGEVHALRTFIILIVNFFSRLSYIRFFAWLSDIFSQVERLLSRIPTIDDNTIYVPGNHPISEKISLTMSELGDILAHPLKFKFHLVKVSSIDHSVETGESDERPHTMKGTELRCNGNVDTLLIQEHRLLSSCLGLKKTQMTRQINARVVKLQSTAMMANMTFPVEWTRSNYIAACGTTINRAQNDVNINIDAEGYSRRVAYSEAYYAITASDYWEKGYLNITSPDGASGKSGDTALGKFLSPAKHQL